MSCRALSIAIVGSTRLVSSRFSIASTSTIHRSIRFPPPLNPTAVFLLRGGAVAAFAAQGKSCTSAAAGCSLSPGMNKLADLLASDWSDRFLRDDAGKTSPPPAAPGANTPEEIRRAARRTIPLLSGGVIGGGTDSSPSSVPFLCRYRPEVVRPMTPAQVHRLRELVEAYTSLKALRARALAALDDARRERLGRRREGRPARVEAEAAASDEAAEDADHAGFRRRMMLSTSRSELEELYKPFKPLSKGSIAERMASSHPEVVAAVDFFWSGEDPRALAKFIGDRHRNTGGAREAALHLMGGKIAANPRICDLTEEMCTGSGGRGGCVMKVKQAKTKVSGDKKSGGKNSKKHRPGKGKYDVYHDFSQPLKYLRDHQVLAIRRGANAKELSMTNSPPDSDFVQRRMFALLATASDPVLPPAALEAIRNSMATKRLLNEAVEDAWARLLKRRSCAAVWRKKVADAERRAGEVFATNLRDALVVPPLARPRRVLALDPGMGAGTKIAMLEAGGGLIDHPKALSTLKFLGSEARRSAAVEELAEMLEVVARGGDDNGDRDGKVLVAVGNGHGSDESVALVQEACALRNVPVDVSIVNEAGASVWSVTEAAAREFPGREPASVGAVSIGRRIQDPMNELVKIPPRSIGLGMYQHDLPEKDLEDRLMHATIDTVAIVGVDANTASLELLKNVPGLSKGKLAENVIDARPFLSREDLKKVKGLGAKTFENCAGFVRIRIDESKEVLDSTVIHPESYDVAKWLMKKVCSDLVGFRAKFPSNTGEKLVAKASAKFGISPERVETIVEALSEAGEGVDPRFKIASARGGSSNRGAADECEVLPLHLKLSLSALKYACPVRNVRGVVRNIADFGAFIDFGMEQNGLIHESRMGSGGRDSLTVGTPVGIDILGVCLDTSRVALSIAGLGFDAESFAPRSKSPRQKRERDNNDTTQSGQRAKRRRT